MAGFAQQNSVNHGSSSVASGTLAYSSNVVMGNLLVCLVVSFIGGGTSVSTITDSQTNPWSRQGSLIDNTAGTRLELWAAVAAASAANTLTITMGVTSFWIAGVAEYSAARFALDTSIGAGDGSAVTSHSSGNTPIAAMDSDLIIGGYGDAAAADSPAITDGKNQRINVSTGMSFILGDTLLATAGVQSSAFSTSPAANGCSGCWAFQSPSAGVPANVQPGRTWRRYYWLQKENALIFSTPPPVTTPQLPQVTYGRGSN